MRPDGSNERTVMRLERGYTVTGFSWSPDGRQILLSLETPPDKNYETWIRHLRPRGGREQSAQDQAREHLHEPSGLVAARGRHSHRRQRRRRPYALGCQARRERCTEAAQRRVRRGSAGVVSGRHADCLLRRDPRLDPLDERRRESDASGSRAPRARTRSRAPSQKIVFYRDRDIWVVNPDGSGRSMAIKGEGEEYGFDIAPGRTNARLRLPGRAAECRPFRGEDLRWGGAGG